MAKHIFLKLKLLNLKTKKNMKQIEKQINNLSENELKEMTLRIIENSYTLIQWPESQDLMEKEWFDKESILDVEGKHGSSSYFIPTWRLY
jgi:hypothetical protein